MCRVEMSGVLTQVEGGVHGGDELGGMDIDSDLGLFGDGLASGRRLASAIAGSCRLRRDGGGKSPGPRLPVASRRREQADVLARESAARGDGGHCDEVVWLYADDLKTIYGSGDVGCCARQGFAEVVGLAIESSILRAVADAEQGVVATILEQGLQVLVFQHVPGGRDWLARIG